MAELSTSTIYGDITISNNQYVKGQCTIEDGLSVNGNISANSIDVNGNNIATETWVSNNFNNYSLETHDNTHHSDNYYKSGDNATFNSINLTRTGINATESWLEINAGSSGILMNYTDKNECRFYGSVSLAYSSTNVVTLRSQVLGAETISTGGPSGGQNGDKWFVV